jgi:hypothetical protein
MLRVTPGLGNRNQRPAREGRRGSRNWPIIGLAPAPGWGLAFLHIAVVIFLGRIVFAWLGPRSLAGDRVAAPARN